MLPEQRALPLQAGDNRKALTTCPSLAARRTAEEPAAVHCPRPQDRGSCVTYASAIAGARGCMYKLTADTLPDARKGRSGRVPPQEL